MTLPETRIIIVDSKVVDEGSFGTTFTCTIQLAKEYFVLGEEAFYIIFDGKNF